MIQITNFTPQACAYRSFNRVNAERHFKIRDEFNEQAQQEKNPEKKIYFFGQAALRDTKARESWEKTCAHAETLGTLVSDADAIAYKMATYPNAEAPKQLGQTTNLSWWKTWLTNFV